MKSIIFFNAGLIRFKTSGSGGYCFFNALFKITLPACLTNALPLELLTFYQGNRSIFKDLSEDALTKFCQHGWANAESLQ